MSSSCQVSSLAPLENTTHEDMTTSVTDLTPHTAALTLTASSPPNSAIPHEPELNPKSPSSECLKANLTCEIHPIFARKYWFAISDGEYEQFKPALQLTTMFMNTPASLGFFATSLFGERTYEEYASEKEGEKKFRVHILNEARLTPFKAERVRDMFYDLEGIVKFTCQACDEGSFAETVTIALYDLTDDERSDYEWGHHIERPTAWSARMSLKHGMTVDRIEGEEMEFCWPEPTGIKWDPWDLDDSEGEKPLQDPRTQMTPSTVAVSTQFLLDLRGKVQSAENTLRSNFIIDVVLIHELAHAVESARPECREWNVDEAMYPGEETAEVGYQVETRVFGAVTECVHRANYWLQFNQDRDHGEECWAVPLEYLARIQQQEFWDSVQSTYLTNMELLHMPETEALTKELD